MIRLIAVVCLFMLLPVAPADARVDRFGIFVGNNRGDRDERTLRYAETDAAKMYQVMRGIGGFRAENVALLQGESPSHVRRALIALNHRIRRFVDGGRNQAVLFVYYSGHGDASALHLGSRRLKLGVLEQLVSGSAATVRLLVVDACRSGGLTRVKGGRRIPAFRIALDKRLSGEGVVFLTSSSANEDAHESDALKGSFFTHYLVSGMLGAADTDRNNSVTLQEVYRYAYDNTLRASSRTIAGPQHPTFRYDLRGKGNVALTVLGQATRGMLAFPRGRAYLVLAGSARGQVVAEVGLRDRTRRISLKPGRYFVRGRARDHLLEGIVKVRRGRLAHVADAKLTRIAYARFVRKGVGELRASHSVQAGYRVRTGVAGGAHNCHVSRSRCHGVTVTSAV